VPLPDTLPFAPFTSTIVNAASSEVRLEAARSVLRRCPPGAPVLIVGASRSAVDELARSVVDRGATFGWHRFSLLQLAARLAAVSLASEGRVPGGPLSIEAAAARAVFELADAGALRYFGPVARTPGFPLALTRTVADLRLAQVEPDALEALDAVGLDLRDLLERIGRGFEAARIVDRPGLLEAAVAAIEARQPEAMSLVAERPVILLDVPVTGRADAALVEAIVRVAGPVLATVPRGDGPSLRALEQAMGLQAEAPEEPADSDLGRLRRWLSDEGPLDERTPDGGVELFSAPGEGREAVEIARRVLREAQRGVPFDQMAVLVRAPQQYLGLLEHAFDRAGIPAWFERGTRRPDPAGRAFLALLRCAEEELSARRFAEYLSLGQVPDDPVTPPPTEWEGPDADGLIPGLLDPQEEEEDPLPSRRTVTGDEPVVDGMLRVPWRWEQLLVESAVIGGFDRWNRRLEGLAEEYRRRIAELRAEDPASSRADAVERDLANLAHLQRFALPILAQLDRWREATLPWGTWIDELSALAPRVLRRPGRVLRVLSELRPMEDVGPVGIAEVRKVLMGRLRMLPVDPGPRRHGRVFVGTPEQARGRSFRVVFVPGLAERIFPQKVREDPLLVDERRAALGAGLADRGVRAQQERQQLRLAVGAATERLYVSYPRIDLGESRPRVPSFYALDVKLAQTGRIPQHEDLQREAAAAGQATLAWPAPADPLAAIDPFEHDLAVLRPLLDRAGDPASAGGARYLLELNACLARSVRERWARWRPQWSEADGLIRATESVAPALATQRLGARPYSLSALQQFAICPYKFLLAAVHRLAPREEPAPLQRLDPLTRGSLFHRIQAELLAALRDDGALPVTRASLPAARARLDETVRRIAEEERERLAPAIPRVWGDEIDAIARDLHRWLELLAEEPDGWVPHYFEYGFGLGTGDGRDPASRPDPVLVDNRFLLRGSIDLVERHPTGVLRVTDHKTGRARSKTPLIVGGGEVLQPVLYSLALEAATGQRVHEGRLWFCTAAGEFRSVPVPITETSRRVGLQVLEIIDRAIELGTLAPYPRKDACRWCDFQPVCGTREERRIARKVPNRFPDIDALRAFE